MNKAVIVAYGRTAVGKGVRGALRETRSDDLAACVVKGTLAKTPSLSPERIEDLILGCAFPEAEQGMNMARTVGLRAGLPESTAAMTVNRFCSSGLQAIAIAANSIAVGQAEVVLAGGAESMSMTPMPGNIPAPNPYLMDTNPSAHMTMGATAENVAERYSVSREDQDAFAYDSHIKAANAQAAGRFEDQIIPVEAVETIVDEKGFARVNKRIFDKDEGIRANITMESLQKLRPVFKAGGSVTPGNASQISDGAAVALLMREEKARELGLRPLAYVRSYAVVGVNPAYMGIGPIKAIPKALKCAGLSLSDIQLFELNEAFASQAIACIRELELKPSIVNINGGAIALGHPLGCTGALLTTKLLSEMERQGLRYGVVSMCIGGGMGAAAVFERIDG